MDEYLTPKQRRDRANGNRVFYYSPVDFSQCWPGDAFCVAPGNKPSYYVSRDGERWERSRSGEPKDQ